MKTESIKITCDHCGADLTYAASNMDLFITVEWSQKIFTAYTQHHLVMREIPKDRHFCNDGCLKGWLNDG